MRVNKVQAIVDAYLDEGPNPRYHRMAKKQLHKQWPTLAQALDALTAPEPQREDPDE